MRHTLLFTLMTVFVLAACTASDNGYETLADGNASRGEILFTEGNNGAPACSSCHLLTDETLVGPGLAGYGNIAETRLEGQSAEEYTYHAIIRPGDFLVDGYANLMFTEYRFKLSEQDIVDLIAFLLTQ